MIKRQKYHLEPDRGLLNDPNGLVFYKDMYHVFFQWNRFEKNHSYKEWGHFTSKDLLHWNWEGSALLPEQGVVSVNGEVVTELGTKIKRADVVKFHDETVSIERKVYVLLNKPKDCVTTSDDPQARLTVMDLVKGACAERIYPVGRLDRNTTGVLLLTNDGDLASKLTHPKYLKKKIYHVYLDKNLTKADMDQIAAGIQLEDGEIHADAISYSDEVKRDQVGIEIHSGKNRIVRRIFESLGYKVVKLDRVFFAGLTKKGLRRGEWRYLTEQEVNFLRMGSFE